VGVNLGEGAFGSVSTGISRLNGEKRAIKSILIDKAKSGSKEREKFLNEVETLRTMDHPNIIKIYEFFEDNKHFHLVTELCTGGELFDYLIKKKKLTE
jgi:calcium-dependent protein kinase